MLRVALTMMLLAGVGNVVSAQSVPEFKWRAVEIDQI